jgi:hypothetical protein
MQRRAGHSTAWQSNAGQSRAKFFHRREGRFQSAQHCTAEQSSAAHGNVAQSTAGQSRVEQRFFTGGRIDFRAHRIAEQRRATHGRAQRMVMQSKEL